MATPTYIALASYTVTGSSDASVTFSSIPATPYRDLVIVVNGKSDSNARAFYIRFNGAAAESNTAAVYVSNASAYTDTGLYMITDDDHFFSTIHVMDYASSKGKNVIIRNNLQDQVWMGFGRWSETSAVNSITLDRSGYVFQVGTTFSLFGVH